MILPIINTPLQQPFDFCKSEIRDFLTTYSVRAFLLEIVKQSWPAYLLASILILVGFHWSLPSAYQDKSFQADENAAVWAVNQIHFPMFNPRWFPWGTGLFYQAYLLKLVFAGGGLVDVSDYWIILMGRLVVFASALGAISVLFLLGRKLFDTRTGQLAAIIFAVLPGFVVNSHYFKTDVPMTVWMLVTLLTAYQLIETGSSRYVFVLGFLVGYTASVKYSGGLLLAVGLVAIAMTAHKFHERLPWVRYLACVVVGFAFGEPAVLLPRGWMAIIDGLRWVKMLNSRGLPYYVARPPAWIDYPLNVMPYSMTAPILVAAIIALVWVITKETRRFLPILTFLAAYYPLLSSDNWRLVRYTVPLLPIASLFVAAFVTHFNQSRLIRRVTIAAFSAMVGYAFFFSLSYVRVMAQVDPRIHATQWVEEHLPKDRPIPLVPAWDLDNVQLSKVGYSKTDVDFSVSKLKKVESPYLVMSEFGTSFYQQAIDFYPEHKKFLDYVAQNYTEIVHFENSQTLFGINSKRGMKLPQDWLHPNPRITILVRRNHPHKVG